MFAFETGSIFRFPRRKHVAITRSPELQLPITMGNRAVFTASSIILLSCKICVRWTQCFDLDSPGLLSTVNCSQAQVTSMAIGCNCRRSALILPFRGSDCLMIIAIAMQFPRRKCSQCRCTILSRDTSRARTRVLRISSREPDRFLKLRL